MERKGGQTSLSVDEAREPLLPPIVFPGATSTERKRIAKLKAAGRLRQVGPRLYVSVPENLVAATLRQAWSSIVNRLFPDALISHRTALDFMPGPKGEVIITSTVNRRIRYPGLVLEFVRGPGALRDDPAFLSIRSSSFARALLENLNARASTRSRVVSADVIEARLEKFLHTNGETELNALRDRARQIAEELGWNAAFKRLDALVGTLLGTRRATSVGAVAAARNVGEPFDAASLERQQILFGELRTPRPVVLDNFAAKDHATNKAFFEAYFSNFIEGTTFEIAEAEAIIFDKKIPTARPKDAHDVLGTFEIVSDLGGLRRLPTTFEEFLATLRDRHARMMARRPEAFPGMFKTSTNRAGETVFVHPDYVRGTLRKGWELSRDVPGGLSRAIFMAFLVSDVHPFVDGNGRLCRIMMNAELAATGQTTIIIPTVFRDDYLLALRALTRRHRPAPLVDALSRAQRFSHAEFAPYPTILQDLERKNWFREPDSARIVD